MILSSKSALEFKARATSPQPANGQTAKDTTTASRKWRMSEPLPRRGRVGVNGQVVANVPVASNPLWQVSLETLLARPLRHLSTYQQELIFDQLSNNSPTSSWFEGIVRGRNFSIFGPRVSARILVSACRLFNTTNDSAQITMFQGLHQIVNSLAFCALSLRVKLSVVELFDLLGIMGKQTLGSIFFPLGTREGACLNPRRAYEKPLFDHYVALLQRASDGFALPESHGEVKRAGLPRTYESLSHAEETIRTPPAGLYWAKQPHSAGSSSNLTHSKSLGSKFSSMARETSVELFVVSHLRQIELAIADHFYEPEMLRRKLLELVDSFTFPNATAPQRFALGTHHQPSNSQMNSSQISTSGAHTGTPGVLHSSKFPSAA